MAKVERFEDLKVWQNARQLAKRVGTLIDKTSLKKDWELKRQMNRSSGSIMDNIAEGFERGGRKEFIQFLSIAKGSAGEVRSQCWRAWDRDLLNDNDYQECKNDVEHVSKQISNLIHYLNQSEYSGVKYNQSIAKENKEEYKSIVESLNTNEKRS